MILFAAFAICEEENKTSTEAYHMFIGFGLCWFGGEVDVKILLRTATNIFKGNVLPLRKVQI